MGASIWDPDTGALTTNDLAVVNSIADLRDFDKNSGVSSIIVLGYYTPRDGGGGIYYYDSADLSTADNGGSVIVADDLARWKLINVAGHYSVLQFGAKGDSTTDDTSAFNATFVAATADKVSAYAPGKTYLVQNVAIPSNLVFYGDGWGKTILLQKESGVVGYPFLMGVNIGNGGTTSVADNISNITIRHMEFKRTNRTAMSGAGDALQQLHLLSFSAVSDLTIQFCYFNGFQGDGIYLGSTNDNSAERHNERVAILDCKFDGIDYKNRNAISVIDVDGLVVERCLFTRCADQTYMPGAIDLEPNANAYHIIKNVLIRKNKFKAVGGNVASVSILVPSAVTTIPSNIEISSNLFSAYAGASGGGDINYNTNRAATTTSLRSALKILNNKGENGTSPLFLYDGSNVRVEGNTWTDYTREVFCGNTGGTNVLYDVVFRDNEFIRLGSTSGKGLTVFTVTRLEITSNVFDDCGTGGGGSANAIDFNTGTSANVSVLDNRFVSPTAKTLIALQKEAGHTFTPATNRNRGNDFNSLTDNFHPPQRATATFNPANLADGAGETTTVGMTGAQMGEPVNVAFSLDITGLTVTAYVQSTSVVAVRFQNESGGALDLASGTLSVTLPSR